MSKILLVEDDEIIQSLVLRFLQKRGHDVVTARDGVVAVELAQAELPDLILMDLRLPVLDGWEATRQIKGLPSTGHIPIIALTAQTLAAERKRSEEAGCDGYITKPINFTYLKEQMASLLAGTGTGSPYEI